jgi:hypothetical protein
MMLYSLIIVTSVQKEDGGSTFHENIGSNYQTTWHHIPEDRTLYSTCCENLKFCTSAHAFCECHAVILHCTSKEC